MPCSALPGRGRSPGTLHHPPKTFRKGGKGKRQNGSDATKTLWSPISLQSSQYQLFAIPAGASPCQKMQSHLAEPLPEPRPNVTPVPVEWCARPAREPSRSFPRRPCEVAHKTICASSGSALRVPRCLVHRQYVVRGGLENGTRLVQLPMHADPRHGLARPCCACSTRMLRTAASAANKKCCRPSQVT